MDLNELNLSSGDEVNYFFEVWDNDQINGRKSNKSFDGKYKELTKNELIDVRNLENEKIKTSIDNSIELAKEIQKEIDELKKTLVDKKTNIQCFYLLDRIFFLLALLFNNIMIIKLAKIKIRP